MAGGGAKSERRLYGTLDGMRGVAAIAVVVLHAPRLFGPVAAPSAGLAVDLFFVMSGFIIAHAYERKLLEGALSAARFVALRLIRLYPLYLIGLGLGIVEALAEYYFGRTQAWTAPQLVLSGVTSLLMMPAAPGILEGAAPAFRLNPPAWSLFFEMVANVLYAVFAMRLSTRVLSGVAAVSGLALVATSLYVGDLNVGSYWNTLWGGFPRVVFSFSVGLLIYRFRDQLSFVKAPPLLILVAAGALFLVDAGRWSGVYEVACTLVILPALVVLGASTEPGKRLLPACKFLGLTSYAVYSLHYPLLMAFQAVARKLWGDEQVVAMPWLGLFFLAMLLVGCGILVRLYDVPARRRLVNALERRAFYGTAATNEVAPK